MTASENRRPDFFSAGCSGDGKPVALFDRIWHEELSQMKLTTALRWENENRSAHLAGRFCSQA
jgi:hypothetical protein